MTNLIQVYWKLDFLLENSFITNRYSDSKFNFIVKSIQQLECSKELKALAISLNNKNLELPSLHDWSGRPNYNEINNSLEIIRELYWRVGEEIGFH